jgi:hypothetical protein
MTGPWFSQPKLQLMKQPLTLTDCQNYLPCLSDMMLQKFSIPDALSIPELARQSPKVSIHDFQFFGSLPLSTPRFFLIFQTTGPSRLKIPGPSLNGRRIMTEYLAYFVTGHILRNKQRSVEAVIIPRLFRANDFVPQGSLRNFSIGNLHSSHSRFPPYLYNTKGKTKIELNYAALSMTLYIISAYNH